MEGASIAQVCYLDKIPFLVIRSITDKLDGSSKVDFEKFLEDRNQLSNRYQSMEGLTRDEFQASWYEFMGD